MSSAFMFQFHTGSIKSRHQLRGLVSRFNSPLQVDYNIQTSNAFQFHTGSIKR